MRKLLGGALLLAATGMALAADLPPSTYYTVPEPLTAASWAGPYLGANGGYQWSSVANNPARPTGLAGGIEAGYNWQSRQFVFGGESDFELSAANDGFAALQFSTPWYGTLRGRGGVAIGNVLLFGTAGLAYGNLRAQTALGSESNGGIGWVAGAGVEVGITPRWSAKAEWLYLDLADHSYALTGGSNGLAANLLRLGLNYRF